MSRSLRGTDDLEVEKEITIEKILTSLIKKDKDLDLKTIIDNPEILTLYREYAKYLRKEGFKKFSSMVRGFIRSFEGLSLSKGGIGREGILKAISSILDKERLHLSISEKLTKNLK